MKVAAKQRPKYRPNLVYVESARLPAHRKMLFGFDTSFTSLCGENRNVAIARYHPMVWKALSRSSCFQSLVGLESDLPETLPTASNSACARCLFGRFLSVLHNEVREPYVTLPCPWRSTDRMSVAGMSGSVPAGPR